MNQRPWFIFTIIVFILAAVLSAITIFKKEWKDVKKEEKKPLEIKAEVSPYMVTRKPGSKIKYYLDIKTDRRKKETVSLTNEVEGPAGRKFTALGWGISPSRKVFVLNKKYRQIFRVKIPQNTPPGLYRIKNKIVAKNLYKEASLLVEVIKPMDIYLAEKTDSPPVLTEKSCSPCYWGKKKRIRFADYTGKSDNSVSFYSVWDDENLYLAATVYDKDIFCNFKSESKIMDSDHLQIFLKFNQKKQLPSGGKLWLAFSPHGLNQAAKIYDEGKLDYALKIKFPWIRRVEGTINNSQDKDIGYWIVSALPWRELGIKPYPKMEIGFNIINVDHSTKNPSKYYLFSWAEDIKSLREIYNYSLWKKIILQDLNSS